jgi:predicted NUDIX family phosphoesterase
MEFVFVVPRERLFPDCYPQGLVPFARQDDRTGAPSVQAFEETVREHGFFVERDYAERTPALKQIIPYTLATRGEQVLLLRRLRAGGEARLHDKLSIGVGGHINPEDLEASDGTNESSRLRPIEAGTRRELEEELVLGGSYRLRRVGILNDDSNPVGAVHVGVVQVLTTTGAIDVREKDVLHGRLVDREELKQQLESGANFETWSEVLVRRLDELLPAQALAHS